METGTDGFVVDDVANGVDSTGIDVTRVLTLLLDASLLRVAAITVGDTFGPARAVSISKVSRQTSTRSDALVS